MFFPAGQEVLMIATYSGPVTFAVNCKTTIALSMMVFFLETVGMPAAHSLGHHSLQQELHPKKLTIVHTHTQIIIIMVY